MNNYILLFRGGLDFEKATPEQIKQVMERWGAWMEMLAKEGKSTAGARLSGDGVVMSGEKKQVTDGPYVEGKEMVGGFISIKANNMDEAIEISKGCPIFSFNGIVEIREMVGD